MYKVSDNYKQQITASDRYMTYSGKITLSDKTEIPIAPSSIVGGTLYVDSKAVNHNEFSVGGCYSSELGLGYFSDSADNISFMNAEIEISANLELPDGSLEAVPLGIFRVDDVSKEKNATYLKALDRMILFDKSYPYSKVTGKTPFELVSQACSECGVALENSSFSGFANSNLSLSTEENQISTYRDLVGMVCEILGAFSIINRSGKLELRKFASTPVCEYTNFFTSTPKLSDSEITIGRVVYNTISSGDGENSVVIPNNSFLETMEESEIKAVLDNIYSQLSNVSFYSGEISTFGDPALDQGDTVSIRGKNVILMGYTWRFRGIASISSYGDNSTSEVEYDSVKKLAQTVSDNYKSLRFRMDDKYASLEASVDGFKAEVSRVESTANEALESVDNLENDVDKQFQNYSTTVEMNSAIEQKANSIMTTVSETFDPTLNQSGSLIALTDSAELPFVGLTLHGNTTQNGTPTPEAPVKLDSVENPVVTITGKNLLNSLINLTATTLTRNGVTFVVNTDKSISINGTATATIYISIARVYVHNIDLILSNGDYSSTKNGIYIHGRNNDGTVQTNLANSCQGKYSFNSGDYDFLDVGIVVPNGETISTTFYPMLRLASISDSTYEPYKVQSIEVPYTLNGVGDVKDYVDFEKGVWVQNFGTYTFTGAEEWAVGSVRAYTSAIANKIKKATNNAIAENLSSDRLPTLSANSTLSTQGISVDNEGRVAIRIDSLVGLTSSDWTSWLTSNPITAIYQLATPTETPLTTEEIEAYKQLHTYKPYTTITNSEGADMEVIYVNQTYSDMQGNLEQRVTKAESSITQNAEKIESKVSKDKIISTINQSAEAVTINANKINLNGVVTANETFKILEDGSMEATGGTIGGWNIEEQRLYGESEKQPDTSAYYRVSLARPYTYDPRHNVFLVEQIGEGVALLSAITAGGQAMFSSLNVTGNTSLYGDVYCTGNIKAKNFERGTLEVTVSSATVYVTKEIPLSFTPTETTQCVLTLRTTGSPQPRYLNCWANYFKANEDATPYLFACLTAGGSSASTVPAGTYYIDYIAANV